MALSRVLTLLKSDGLQNILLARTRGLVAKLRKSSFVRADLDGGDSRYGVILA